MRNLRLIYLILTVFVLLPTGYAQKGNWQAVESLAPGTSISIQARHRVHCKFLTASDDAISCEIESPLHMFDRSLTFAPNDVRQVRIEHPTASMFAGAAIGAGAGVGIASINNKQSGLTPGASKVIGGAILGLVGGFIGCHIPIIPGTIIYQE